MAIAIDLILVVILAACLITGYKKGLIDSVINLLGFFAAVILGYWMSGPLGDYYYRIFFHQAIAESYETSLSASAADGTTLSELIGSLPQALIDFLDKIGINAALFEQTYTEGVSAADEQIRRSIAEFVAQPTAQILSNILAFLTVFIVVLLALGIAKLILNLIFKLPILRTLNKMLGLLLGGVVGLLYVQVLSFILHAALPFLYTLQPTVFPAGLASQTFVFRYLCEHNLFYMMFG